MTSLNDRDRTSKVVKNAPRGLSGGLRKPLAAITAAGLAFGMLAGGAVAAQAAGGGGGGGAVGGGGGTQGNVSTHYMMFDSISANGTPAQGTGQASIDWFFNNSGAGPVGYTPNARTYMQSACTDALANADARSGTSGTSRVVGMYWAGTANEVWGRGINVTSRFQSMYDEWVGNGRPGVITGLNNQSSYYDWIQTGWNDGVSSFTDGFGSAICIALASTEPGPQDYDLKLTTDKGSTFSLAGQTNGVTDTIHASNGGSSISENVNANVILHWTGPEGTTKSVTKSVSIKNSGDTTTPAFAPSDFGWTSWPAGDFWFDVQVAKQGKMSGAVDTPDKDPRESWSAERIKPTKILTTGTGTSEDQLTDNEVLSSGMFYNARIDAHSNGYTSSMTINDTVNTDKIFVGSKTADVVSAAYILGPDGKKVDADISIDRSTSGKVTISGTVKNITNQGDYTLVVPTYVLPTGSDYEIADDSEACYGGAAVGDPSDCLVGNSEVTRKVTPTPDKVWVLDEAGALTAADPNHTNQEGADQQVFLQNDAVAAVVNGHVPANLAENLSQYSITDDWSDAAKYVDFSDASKSKVYFDGNDVTSQFDIKVAGTKTTATATATFLQKTKGLSKDTQVKLIISGQFRDDYDTNGQLVTLTNAGSETWNNETQPTNEPPVFTWTPDPHKYVLGSADQGGDQSDINGLAVWPGQKIEYQVNVDLNIPTNLAHGDKAITSVAVQDAYDANFVPDKTSVEFYDTRSNKAIPRSVYKLSWDDANHTFTATFDADWVAQNVNAGDSGWLIMRFDGRIADGVAGGTIVANTAYQILNGAKIATETPTVNIPTVTPDKEDLSTDNLDIDGKTVVQGDVIRYRLTLDGGPARNELAYDVHKLGMIDDYDQDYLDVSTDAVKVTNKATGEDVTSKFNVQIKDGVLYVFAKTVDSTNTNDELIPGDPQPESLSEYANASIDPVNDPIIDQSLLGSDYWITFDSKVKKETDGYTIVNQAFQNIENTVLATRIVSNPLKDIDPDKDVVVSEQTKDDSINEQEIALDSTFNYRLNSSEIPADRAYAASNWSLTDTFDKVHDQYTGVWAIYANADLYDGDTLIVKKGALLNDSAGHESEALKGLFDVTFDEDSYTFTATATQKYLDLVNTRGDLAQAFSVYTQMIRIAPSDKVENQTTENYNTVDRDSNIVWTSTPENPAISVVKFTLDEGQDKGDRNTADEAFSVDQKSLDAMAADEDGTDPTAGVKVGFHITNTGDVPLTNVTLADLTNEGTSGTVTQIVCEVPLTDEEAAALGADAPKTTQMDAADVNIDLAVDEGFDCEGTLQGLTNGELHGDTVTVKGESVFTGTHVEDSDPWFAKAVDVPATPENPQPGEDPHGAITGDAITSNANPWLIGGGALVLLSALGLGAVLVVRKRRAQSLLESNGSGLEE